MHPPKTVIAFSHARTQKNSNTRNDKRKVAIRGNVVSNTAIEAGPTVADMKTIQLIDKLNIWTFENVIAY